ncbi:MAG: GNAT family N-acetyltransferase [Pyrinomonadaceae bacterium]
MIETERLKLIACTKLHLASLTYGTTALANFLELEEANNWLRSPNSVHEALVTLEDKPNSLRWGMHLIQFKDENRIIGTCGYNGAADADGMVAIDCAIAPDYEGQGFATEAVAGLLDNAFSWRIVEMVDSCTPAGDQTMARVFKKLGFTKVAGETNAKVRNPRRWRLRREEYSASKESSSG